MTKLLPIAAITMALFGVLISTSIYAQMGCKDPLANNYNASATVNDGSCTYNTTNYTPPTKVNPINSILTESSGLQWAGNSLWSFNDGGGAAAIYRIDTLTNALLQTVNLEGASNVDWEDIGFDGTYFYVGDFGNNYDGARSDLKIYKFPISAIPDYASMPVVTISAAQIKVLKFSYGDQPLPLTPTATSNTTKYDCEAMVVDGGKIHLFTKNWVDTSTTHYVIPDLNADSSVLFPVETLATHYLVTAADKTPNKSVIVLLGYQAAIPGNHFMHLLSDYSGNLYFNGNKRQINLPNALDMGQAEGITFRTDTYGYISNERIQYAGFTVNQKLHQFDINSFLPNYILPLQLLSFTANNTNGIAKINWAFNSPINQLEIQKSNTNANNFIVLKTLTNTQTGSYDDKIEGNETFYRLAWKNVDGTLQYSNTINIKTNTQNTISNFHLKQNGKLTFVLNGSNVDYAIRLSDINGRVLAQIPEQAYFIGSNSINLSAQISSGGIVFLSLYNKTQTISQALHIEQ